ncbi:DUF2520 domain-containing protein [Acetomicrobium sp.]|uniref:Rossmann-like and DUF2520 domain-containing protein n=1 Tax=Acetomicrobium sp. TaxID=1872099 RepID=UPI00315932AF
MFALKLGFIGAGKVGSAMAILLKQAGYEIAGVASRSQTSARKLALRLGVSVFTPKELSYKSDVLFITTSDDAIASVATDLARQKAIRPGQIMVHMSGAHTSSLLSPCAEVGAVILSLHPIQSFASIDQAIALIPGSYFSIEGDEGGYDFAQEIVNKLKGKHFILKSNSKVLYHAAASIASNYLVGLLSVTQELLDTAGVPNDVGLQAFLPLIEGTLENVRKLGITDALTGPISRGDISTVSKHMEAMKDLPQILDVYKTLGLVTVEVALKKGTINEKQADKLRALLK